MANMILSTDQIERNITWLLGNSSAPVRYLTHKHLLDTPDDSELMQTLWHQVGKSPDVQEIFSKQKEDGSWCAGGSWAQHPSYIPKNGYSAFTPKYVTTVWILSVLGDMGFTIKDERVMRAFEYAMTYQLPNGLFSRFKVPQEVQHVQQPVNAPCELSVYLLGLGKVSGGDIAPMEKSYSLLLGWQRGDDGWVLERHKQEQNWNRSCPWSSYHATTALYYSNNPAYRDALVGGLEFLVWHLSIKKDHQLQRFFYHGHSTVHELVMLTEYGIGLQEKAVNTILQWLMTMYNADRGCFQYTGKPISQYSWRKGDYMSPPVAKYRLYHLIEDDWLTYYATRIARNLMER